MLENNTTIKVTNRSKSKVTYVIPDMGLRRSFQGNETKEISWEEIRNLSYTDGGLTLIERYLVLDNPEAVKSVLNEVEPEYFYSEADIKDLLTTGSLDALLDCLDFAPAGVIDILKNMAVDLPLNDMEKRDAILEKTGFNVTTAIKIKNTKFDGDTEGEAETGGKPMRRVAPKLEAQESARRTSTPKYKVVSKDN